MRYTSVQPAFFSENRKRFSAMLPENALAFFPAAEKIHRNGDQYFSFRQQSDFYYLTGIEQASCYLLLFPDCPNPLYREVLFIEPWDPVRATWEGYMLTKDDAKIISGAAQVMTTDQYSAVLHECMTYARHVFLNIQEYIKFKPSQGDRQHTLVGQLQSQYPLHQYHRSAPLLEQLRTVKQATEVDLIQKACDITAKAFLKVLQTTKPGMMEYEVEANISHTFTCNAASGHGYHPIVGSGINACVLHYNDNNRQMQSGDLLLMDFGAEYANYTADLSRTIPVNGSFTLRQRQCYDAVLRVFKAAVPLYVQGNTIDQINQAVWAMMEKEMIGLGLFTEAEVAAQNPETPLYRKYLMHGVAHHIGLDVHDVGSKYAPLAPGMVLTCEPGLYIREESIGIRIENDILITEDGPVDLMAGVPIEADEIEAIMQQKIS